MSVSALALGCATPIDEETSFDLTDESAESGSSESFTTAAQELTGPACPNIGLNAPTVRYVCDCQPGAAAGCKAGNDANAGTKDAPFRTYGKARSAFSSLRAGETIAFCRGGSFTIDGDRRWTNPSCRAGSPCVVRDYPPPWSAQALNKPILTATEGDGFAFEDGGNADHEEGYTFLNLDVRSKSGGQSGNGFFMYNDIDDALVCGSSISGFGIGFHAAGSNAPAAGSDGKNARLVLRNSVITNNGNQGFLGGCDGCGVEGSTFDNNGFNEAVLNHNIYFSPRGADGMFALNNDLYRSAIVNGKCEGVSLVVHGQLTNLRIEGNAVHEDVGKAGLGCWGITVDPGYGGEPESFRNVTIRGNSVRNVGNLGIGTSSCQNCVIENNLIVQTQPMDSTLIAAPNRSRNGDDQALGSVVVRNNTLLALNTNRVTGVSLGGEGGGHVAVSNALLSLGSGPFTCFDYDLAKTSYGARNNNLCYGMGSFAWTNTNATLTSWRSASGADTMSLNVNPRFTSTAAPYNFMPVSGSPLVDAGHAISSATIDFLAKTRGTARDIGAYER
jgi:hypothetical protein